MVECGMDLHVVAPLLQDIYICMPVCSLPVVAAYPWWWMLASPTSLPTVFSVCHAMRLEHRPKTFRVYDRMWCDHGLF